MKRLPVWIVGVVLAAVPAAAQQPTDAEIDKYIELARMDIQQTRAQLVGENMQLSAGQAAKFWPIYEQYEAAYAAIGDRELQVIRDYAASYDSMTDAAANDLIARLFDVVDDDLAILREYHGKVESGLGGSVAARFVQVERRIQTLLDLQLAAEIPLLEAPR